MLNKIVQVTVVVVPKFNFIDMLKSISTYKVTHLMFVLQFLPVIALSILTSHCFRISSQARTPSCSFALQGSSLLFAHSTHMLTHVFRQSPETKQYDLSSVRLCLFGAAPLSAELTNQFVKLFEGAEVGQGYGMPCSILIACSSSMLTFDTLGRV